MAVSSHIELITALGAGDFQKILGTPEGQDIDFKKAPYHLADPKHKWELAKDVAAFANARGGLIVIGVGTDLHPNNVVETASGIHAVRKDVERFETYTDIIRGAVHPVVRGVKLHWFPPDVSVGEGLLVLEVPPQDDADKYFLVRRVIDASGKEVQAFGVPLREGHDIYWLPAEKVHSLIADGMWSRQSDRTAPAAASLRKQEQRLAAATATMEKLLVQQEWQDTPAYVLQAIPPPGPDRLPDFLSEDGLKGALKHKDVLRPEGFHIYPSDTVDAIDGSLMCWHPRRILHLEPHGLLTFGIVATAGLGTLGHYVNEGKPDDDPIALNLLALVETTLEFFRFAHRELKPRGGDGPWTMRLTCFGFKDKVALETHQSLPGPMTFSSPLRWKNLTVATSDHWSKEFESRSDPEADAFLALEELYALFMEPLESGPYVEVPSPGPPPEKGRVDPVKILATSSK